MAGLEAVAAGLEAANWTLGTSLFADDGYVSATWEVPEEDEPQYPWKTAYVRIDYDGSGYFSSNLFGASNWTLPLHPQVVAAMKVIIDFREAIQKGEPYEWSE